MDAQNNPYIVLITMDRSTASVILTRSDGKVARLPLTPSPFEETSSLARLDLSPSWGALLATTLSGDQVLFELPLEKARSQLAGRLVVYLDQNQWSALSNALHDEQRGTKEDLAAARKLMEWVEKRRIVLPASAAHYYETSKRFDPGKRYHLGLTILQYSRGWQMRHPLQVRRNELHDGFCRYVNRLSDVRAEPVFTVAPGALYSEARRPSFALQSDSTDAPLAFQTEALTEAVSSIDVMLGSARTEPGQDIGWATLSQEFSDWLDAEQRDSRQKRKVIDGFLLSDLRKEIADESWAAGLTTSQLESWAIKHAMKEIGTFPAISLFREMLHNRHLNKGTKWRPNDLIDMVYLSCAAGYCDITVCERHMGAVLKHALKRAGRTPRVYRDLAGAVGAIDDALRRTPAPRRGATDSAAQ